MVSTNVRFLCPERQIKPPVWLISKDETIQAYTQYQFVMRLLTGELEELYSYSFDFLALNTVSLYWDDTKFQCITMKEEPIQNDCMNFYVLPPSANSH